MAKSTKKKTTKRKRTTLKDLPAKVKDVTMKNAGRVRGGVRPGTSVPVRTVNGL